jgi:hypothetical protein|tara:strand:- start:2798 stop:2932 length:135 start_codon:yes stop_codon:yes gene_type:complete
MLGKERREEAKKAEKRAQYAKRLKVFWCAKTEKAISLFDICAFV